MNKKLGRKELREYKDKIIKMYTQDKMSTYQIGEKLNAYAARIKDILVENNIKLREYSETNRHYSLDEHFFDKIDTEEKAYVLGFLYADGCNSSSGRTVKIELELRDKEVLEKIKKVTNNESNFHYCNKGKKKNGENRDYVSISFNSKYMAQVLKEKGVTPKKSLILQFPNWLDENMYSHFIRGYFDGDGSVSKSGNGLQCSITSTIFFNEKINEYLHENGIESFVRPIKWNNITTVLRVCKQDSVKKFLDFIYRDATIYLERKYNKYINQYYNK